MPGLVQSRKLRDPLRFVSVDDLLESAAGFSVQFEYSRIREAVHCTVSATHCGNSVYAEGYGLHSGDALLDALAQIEKTIGDYAVDTACYHFVGGHRMGNYIHDS
jgi:hypothetical protein